MMMVVLVVGLASIVETMGFWFDWVRPLGAAYLVWLGWKLLRTSGAIDAGGGAPKPRGGFFPQGFLVMLGNPKTLIFFGAFFWRVNRIRRRLRGRESQPEPESGIGR